MLWFRDPSWSSNRTTLSGGEVWWSVQNSQYHLFQEPTLRNMTLISPNQLGDMVDLNSKTSEGRPYHDALSPLSPGRQFVSAAGHELPAPWMTAPWMTTLSYQAVRSADATWLYGWIPLASKQAHRWIGKRAAWLQPYWLVVGWLIFFTGVVKTTRYCCVCQSFFWTIVWYRSCCLVTGLVKKVATGS